MCLAHGLASPRQTELMTQFKKIAADKKVEGKGKKKKTIESVDGGGARGRP